MNLFSDLFTNFLRHQSGELQGLSMEGHESLWFHYKYLHLYFRRQPEGDHLGELAL